MNRMLGESEREGSTFMAVFGLSNWKEGIAFLLEWRISQEEKVFGGN